MMPKHHRKVFVYGEALNENGYPPECPFDTSRARKTFETLSSMGLLSGSDREVVAPVAADRTLLAGFHDDDYLDALQQASEGTLSPYDALMLGLGTPDCPIFPGMYEYLFLQSGTSVTGARLILDGKADIVFNPSGGLHHAHANRASGFCYINDVVLAIREFVQAGKRCVFLDIDVHHADGVQEAFYASDDVLTISMHEDGRTLFPGTGFEDEIGVDAGRGYTMNLPMPVGTYDKIYRKAFQEAVLPVVEAFDADIVIIELGMDVLAGDPLAHLHLTNNTHAHILKTMMEQGKPVLATGGGGYHVENTVRAWSLCWSVMCGDDADHEDLAMGMGGVMLESTDWAGGLRDRVLLGDGGRHDTVDREVRATVEKLKTSVFPIHGID
jgi:acetoin utilization protein AcuC